MLVENADPVIRGCRFFLFVFCFYEESGIVSVKFPTCLIKISCCPDKTLFLKILH